MASFEQESDLLRVRIYQKHVRRNRGRKIPEPLGASRCNPQGGSWGHESEELRKDEGLHLGNPDAGSGWAVYPHQDVYSVSESWERPCRRSDVALVDDQLSDDVRQTGPGHAVTARISHAVPKWYSDRHATKQVRSEVLKCWGVCSQEISLVQRHPVTPGA